jgi:hypothetical protein
MPPQPKKIPFRKKQKKGHDILWKWKLAKRSSKTKSSMKTKLGGH